MVHATAAAEEAKHVEQQATKECKAETAEAVLRHALHKDVVWGCVGNEDITTFLCFALLRRVLVDCTAHHDAGGGHCQCRSGLGLQEPRQFSATCL